MSEATVIYNIIGVLIIFYCLLKIIEDLKEKKIIGEIIIGEISMWKILKWFIYLSIAINLLKWFLIYNQNNIQTIWKIIQTLKIN